MKIKTKDLQNLLPILKSVVGNNELQPDTTRLGIKTTDDALVLYAMGRDKVKLILKVENPDKDIDIAVKANLFLGLLSKITTEEIELTIDKNTNNLEFKGNGTYHIEIEMSELGPITFEDISIANLTNSIGIISKDTIKTIIDNNSFALLKVKESESLGRFSTGNYHIKIDNTMTSNGDIISKSLINSGLSKDISLSPTTINTLLTENNDITIYEVGNNLMCINNDNTFILSSPKVIDSDQFPYDELNKELNDSLYDTTITIEKAAILSTIDRLNLFNTDDSPLNITFSNNVVTFNIKEQQETINSNGDGKDTLFPVNVQEFLDSIKVIKEENIIFKINLTTKNSVRIDGVNLINAISIEVADQVV